MNIIFGKNRRYKKVIATLLALVMMSTPLLSNLDGALGGVKAAGTTATYLIKGFNVKDFSDYYNTEVLKVSDSKNIYVNTKVSSDENNGTVGSRMSYKTASSVYMMKGDKINVMIKDWTEGDNRATSPTSDWSWEVRYSVEDTIPTGDSLYKAHDDLKNLKANGNNWEFNGEDRKSVV